MSRDCIISNIQHTAEDARLGIDSHADMSYAGKNARIIRIEEGRTSTVYPFNDSMSASFQISMKSSIHAVPRLKDASEVEAVAICLERSHDDFAYDEISIDHQVSDEANATNNNTRDEGMRSLNLRRTVVQHVSAPMFLSELTMKNLGRVHYQLAVLHGIGRFQDEMPEINRSIGIHGQPGRSGNSIAYAWMNKIDFGGLEELNFSAQYCDSCCRVISFWTASLASLETSISPSFMYALAT